MTFQEFEQAVMAVTGDKYLGVGIEASPRGGRRRMRCIAYVEGGAVSRPTPEETVAALRELFGSLDADIAAIGEVA